MCFIRVNYRISFLPFYHIYHYLNRRCSFLNCYGLNFNGILQSMIFNVELFFFEMLHFGMHHVAMETGLLEICFEILVRKISDVFTQYMYKLNTCYMYTFYIIKTHISYFVFVICICLWKTAYRM